MDVGQLALPLLYVPNLKDFQLLYGLEITPDFGKPIPQLTFSINSRTAGIQGVFRTFKGNLVPNVNRVIT